MKNTRRQENSWDEARAEERPTSRESRGLYKFRPTRSLSNTRRPAVARSRRSLSAVVLTLLITHSCSRLRRPRTPWLSLARWTAFPANRCWAVSALVDYFMPQIKLLRYVSLMCGFSAVIPEKMCKSVLWNWIGVWTCVFGCPQVAVPGKDEDRWRGKEEGVLFKRWRRSSPETAAPPASPAQPSELLKFLAIVSIVYLFINWRHFCNQCLFFKMIEIPLVF